MSTQKLQNVNLDQMVMSFAQLSAALVSFTVTAFFAILIVNNLFPRELVLGTHMLSAGVSAFYGALAVSLIAVGVMPLIEYVANARQMDLTNAHWMMLYWVVNAGAVWFVGRFAEILGMGLGSWVVAVLVGLLLDIIQGLLMRYVVSRVKN